MRSSDLEQPDAAYWAAEQLHYEEQSVRTRRNDSNACFFNGLFMDEIVLMSKGVAPSAVAPGFVGDFAVRIADRERMAYMEYSLGRGRD